MTSSEVLVRIPVLLGLPVLGEPGFEKVRLPEVCPEPFDLYGLRTKIRKGTTLAGECGATIDRLIRLVSKGNLPITRSRAAARLGGLHKLGLLTLSQQSDFAKALWSELDENTSLPANTDFYRFAFLGLPEIKPGEAKCLVRAYLLKTEVPRVFSRTRLADGKEQKAFNPTVTNNRFLQELNGATKPLFPSDKEEAHSIDWSTEECVSLINSLNSWWQEEKADLRGRKNGQWFNPHDQLREQFEEMVKIIANALLPRMSEAEARTKDQTSALLSEMEKQGFCILAAVPMQLFINHGSVDEAASRIRGGLISNDESIVQQAIRGLFLWLAHSQRGKLTAPPEDLLVTQINKVKTRAHPALVDAIAWAASIIESIPSAVTDLHVADLAIGLEYLFLETALSGPFIADVDDAARLIPVAKLPVFRKYACELASGINAWCINLKKPVPASILKWKQASQTDVLPEVRAAWAS
jgi:hypothetical protein